MRRSNAYLIASADAIAPLVRPIVAQRFVLTPSDVIAALRTAKQQGANVTTASSQRSVSVIMDRLCATL